MYRNTLNCIALHFTVLKERTLFREVFKNRPAFQERKMNEAGRDWFFLVGVTTLFIAS